MLHLDVLVGLTVDQNSAVQNGISSDRTSHKSAIIDDASNNIDLDQEAIPKIGLFDLEVLDGFLVEICDMLALLDALQDWVLWWGPLRCTKSRHPRLACSNVGVSNCSNEV